MLRAQVNRHGKDAPLDRIVVIGAGVGGLTAAVELATRGRDVLVLERADRVGGKLRAVCVDGAAVDSGPTVFTMRWVFEEIFDDAGADFAAAVPTVAARRLARHAWSAQERLDLYADVDQSAEAIAAFAGPREAMAYRRFAVEARRIYKTLEAPFLASQRPAGPLALAARVGVGHLGDLAGIRPFETLWSALSGRFRDPRLRQLFARYATYSGSSPFLAPATLMLIAHVEQDGVWLIEGGMERLAVALAALAHAKGVTLRTGAHVAAIETGTAGVEAVRLADGERVACRAVVMNGDAAALTQGLLGAPVAAATTAQGRRSQSALTWSMRAQVGGFPLIRHTVFFSNDYRAEFAATFGAGALPASPTIYVCAQDRSDEDAAPGGEERLFCLVNAPARDDADPLSAAEIDRCEDQVFRSLAQCGLSLARSHTVRTSPAAFAQAYPGTNGALYGAATHGPLASFRRPAARTRIPGLYLAGGSAHPGAGLPLAALSGRLAAQALLKDLPSTSR